MNLHQNLHHFNLISQDDVGHGRKIKCFFNQNHKNAYKIGLFRNLSAVIERQRISSYIQTISQFVEIPIALYYRPHVSASPEWFLRQLTASFTASPCLRLLPLPPAQTDSAPRPLGPAAPSPHSFGRIPGKNQPFHACAW